MAICELKDASGELWRGEDKTGPGARDILVLLCEDGIVRTFPRQSLSWYRTIEQPKPVVEEKPEPEEEVEKVPLPKYVGGRVTTL